MSGGKKGYGGRQSFFSLFQVFPFHSPPQVCSTQKLKFLPCLPPSASPSAPPMQGLRRVPGQRCGGGRRHRPLCGAGERHPTTGHGQVGGSEPRPWGPARARSGGKLWPYLLLWALLGRGRRAECRGRGWSSPLSPEPGAAPPRVPGRPPHPLPGARRRQPAGSRPGPAPGCGDHSTRPLPGRE